MMLPPQSPRFAYLPPAAKQQAVDNKALRASTRAPMLAGLAVVALIVAAFGGWAATAPLAGGAVAFGVISPDTSRKTIQHLEGGIIAEILVRDGDFVAVGEPLLTLEDTQARAAYEVLRHEYQALIATQARLTAEQLGRDDILFPQGLLAASDEEEVQDIIAIQRQLFATRKEAVAAQKQVLNQRILQIREQIEGLSSQLDSSERRVRIVAEELKAKEFLLGKQLLPKSEVLAVRRAWADIQGDRGEYRAGIAQAVQKIGETQLELVSLDAQRADEIAANLDQVRGQLAKVRQQLAASEDTLKRTTITAPIAGTVVDLRFKTRSGVIMRGEPILDIVPANDDLLIDARVAPIDIDVVHPGLSALVHLSAYKQRSLPQIKGEVRSVSADSLRDEHTGTSYYLARIEVDREQLARMDSDIQLVPGMPAEVLIVTGERTLFGYLFEPFRDLFRRSLREV